MTMQFKKATKHQAKLRMALHGPSGSGKTFSALAIGKHLGAKIALIDTERGSAAKYSDKFDFDTLEIVDNYHPKHLIEALDAARGYDVVVVDSLSHFWNGPGGMLELVDEEVAKQKARGHKPDSFSAWKSVDAIYRRVVQTLLSTPFDLVVTMRAKTEYEKSTDDKGKSTIKKVGMAPEIRNSFEYEMDVEGMLDIEHHLVIGKTRCDALDGKVFTKPGADVAKILRAWLSDGAPVPEKPATPPPAPSSAPASEPRPVANGAPASDDPPAMAELSQKYQTRILAAKNDDELKEIHAEAKKDLRGAYLEAYRKAYTRAYKAIHPKPAVVAS